MYLGKVCLEDAIVSPSPGKWASQIQQQEIAVCSFRSSSARQDHAGNQVRGVMHTTFSVPKLDVHLMLQQSQNSLLRHVKAGVVDLMPQA